MHIDVAVAVAILVQAEVPAGISRAGAGETEQAINQYMTFLDRWGDADLEIPVIADAKKRLERLQSAS